VWPAPNLWSGRLVAVRLATVHLVTVAHENPSRMTPEYHGRFKIISCQPGSTPATPRSPPRPTRVRRLVGRARHVRRRACRGQDRNARAALTIQVAGPLLRQPAERERPSHQRCQAWDPGSPPHSAPVCPEPGAAHPARRTVESRAAAARQAPWAKPAPTQVSTPIVARVWHDSNLCSMVTDVPEADGNRQTTARIAAVTRRHARARALTGAEEAG
jgi:hypothetical protein